MQAAVGCLVSHEDLVPKLDGGGLECGFGAGALPCMKGDCQKDRMVCIDDDGAGSHGVEPAPPGRYGMSRGPVTGGRR